MAKTKRKSASAPPPSRAPKSEAPAAASETASVPSSSASASASASAGAPRSRFRTTWILIATAYLITVWLDGVGSNFPLKVTPRVWVYFSQVAALFKVAGEVAIEYRAEGWLCSEKKWVEIDVKPFFRIDADNKENRFHRAMQFYRKERMVMRALEEYVVKSHNGTPNRPLIGGTRFSSLRVPYPKIGDPIVRLLDKPLAEYPPEQRHPWYWTPMSKRRERCGDPPPPTAPQPATPSSPKESPKEDDESSGPSIGPGEGARE